MAIYHFSMQTVSRSSGRSSVAAAAYRAAEEIYEHRTDTTYDYSQKSGVMMAEVITPDGQGLERGHLWNLVEDTEKRVNSTLAREIVIALPCELSSGEQKALARDYATGLSERTGWAVDVAVHAAGRGGDSRNVHAHLLCTTRRFERDEQGYPVLREKTRDWDVRATGSELLKAERQEWEGLVNQALEKAQVQERVDSRSHAEKETGLTPLIHLGPAAMNMERKGISTQRGELYREIARSNALVINLVPVIRERQEEQAWRQKLEDSEKQGFSELQKILDAMHPGSVSLALSEIPKVREVQRILDLETKRLSEIQEDFSRTLDQYYALVERREGVKQDHPVLYHLAQVHLNLDSGVSSVVQREKQFEKELDSFLLQGMAALARVDEALNVCQVVRWENQEAGERSYALRQARYDESFGRLLEKYETEGGSACEKAETIARYSDPYEALRCLEVVKGQFPNLNVSGASKGLSEEKSLRERVKDLQKEQAGLDDRLAKAKGLQQDWKESHRVSAVIHKLYLGHDTPLWFMEKEAWFAREHGKRLGKLEEETSGRAQELKKELSEAEKHKTPEQERGEKLRQEYEQKLEMMLQVCQNRVEQVREKERELQRQREQEQQEKRWAQEMKWLRERDRGDGPSLGR